MRFFRKKLSKIFGRRPSSRAPATPSGLLSRAALRRSVGDWPAAERDLDEVEEIAEPGPMRLFLCNLALERARLALARREAFAPLNGPGPPAPPDAADAAPLLEEARAQSPSPTNSSPTAAITSATRKSPKWRR
jgi:hypothetical protein